MPDPASHARAPERQPSAVEYEQPLTERLRTFLRLEFLYQQASFHAEAESDWNSRAAVASLLDILAITGRGDVRSEVIKELERHAEQLRGFKRQPGVDHGRLESLLHTVESLRSELSEAGSTLVQPLKDSDFLSAIKHRSAIPGGTCVFDLPDYTFWLSRPYHQRAEQLERWLSQLRPLCDAVSEVLWLIRQSRQPRERVAHQGMYQQALERGESPRLLRVIMPGDVGIYPEISGSQHRFTVRFLEFRSVDERPAQTDADIRFLLSLC